MTTTTTTAPAAPGQPEDVQRALAERMARPQRHRLLQGYPPLPLMRHAHGVSGRALTRPRAIDGSRPGGKGETAEPAHITIDRERPLIVGVLPHHMCTPRVEGCGFCTFPHEAHDAGRRRAFAHEVSCQADDVTHASTHQGRRVDAVYFGGATANLSSAKELGEVFAPIARHLRVDGAEVTLEGVPALFLSFLGGPLAWLASLPVRHRRVSMGVQTFDPTQIARMGREAFGDAATVAKVVTRAHARGLTTSGDFLFNLPHQTLKQMLDDVQTAVDIGLDQICIYHLVLYEGLGTPWSKDAALLAALPSPAAALENWLAVRDALLAAGYVQTTLTNFERADVRSSPRRFVYEDASFTPESYDALGVGPAAISGFVDVAQRRAVKWVNSKVLGERGGAGALWFPLDEHDLRLLCLTRWLARLRIERATYRGLFGADVVDEHHAALSACSAAGLLTIGDDDVTLTPRGMFYADSVVGLLASARAAALQAQAAGKSTMKLAAERTRIHHDNHMG